MKKFYSYTYVYLVVFICLHFNIFAKTTDEQPVILKPVPVKALPVRFKPIPFKPLYLNKVDLYQFDQKAYVFGKITSAFPVLTAQEWQTVSNDPVRFTLTPNKESAYVGEEIELILTAELLNISPSALFTFEELRNYTLKVVLPGDFIQTGGTYYDFISDKLDPANPRQTYTIKGRYLAKPALDDCFKVLRKLNNDVFVLKATQCPSITEVDVVSVSNTAVVSDSIKKTRAVTAIDSSKVKFVSYIKNIYTNQKTNFGDGNTNHNVNCGEKFYIVFMLSPEGSNEIIGNGNSGSYRWEFYEDNVLNPLTNSLCNSANNSSISTEYFIKEGVNKFKCKLYVYSASNCTGLLFTKTQEVTVIRGNCNPSSYATPNTITISADKKTICNGSTATLTASTLCGANNVKWYRNGTTFGSNGLTLSVTQAGSYQAQCITTGVVSSPLGIYVGNISPTPVLTALPTTLTSGNSVQLIADDCPGTVYWAGPNNFSTTGSVIVIDQPGTYSAQCTVVCTGTPIISNIATINVPLGNYISISVPDLAVCNGGSLTLSAVGTCPSGNISWRKNEAVYGGTGSVLTTNQAGSYKAVCSSPSMTSNSIYLVVGDAPIPNVSADKTNLAPGEFAELSASGCPGTIFWTGPNNFADVGNQISVNKSGGYNAKCQTTCGGSTIYSGLSATITISVLPLRIESNKIEVAAGESVTLTAYGCTNGYIRWKINGNLQSSTANPSTFTSGGFYSASCTSWDGTNSSEWVTIFINQISASIPTITADKQQAYNNENVILTASGCTNASYNWYIPARQSNGTVINEWRFGNPQTVKGNGTYQVRCYYSDTNQGSWTGITIYQLQPGDITISSNKMIANPGEASELSITGNCPGGAGIQWEISGAYSWTTRYEAKTVYGPGTYKARCIIDDFSYGNWASIRINPPAPGGITVSSSKTSAGSNELVTLSANGCIGEVVWTLPDNTEVRGSDLLYATGPGTYKARCVRFGINGEPATIVIQSKPNDAPRFYATQAVASGNQIFQLVAENCPNNSVQWGIPKQDSNGNPYYDYANFFQTLIVRGPGTYQVRCTEGNYTSFQDIVVFPNPSDALTIVGNKAKALPSEYVVLSAYGCPNGTITWEIGTQTATGAQITTQGPGNYKARCIGDPTNNGNYAIASVMPNGSIVPIIVASINTACPNEAVTLTAYSSAATNGCPAGWPLQWQYVRDDKIDYWLNNRNAIENFGENYTEVFETVFSTQIVRNGPRVYYARCVKPDGSWMGEFKDKSAIIEPVFPQYLRASNNGPALMGATGIRVAVTEVPAGGITYAWTGPNGFTSTLRNPEITNLTEAKSGIYTVTVKRANICSVTATTNLVVSGCSDIRIKAVDPVNGEETNSLPIVANLTNPYGSLALSPVYADGLSIPFSSFLWTKPDGTTSTGEYLITNTPGIYKVKVTPNGSTAGCTTLSYIIKENFHTELWEKAQNLNFQDGTAVTVVPISHKSVDKSVIWNNTSVKDKLEFKNIVVPKLLRYTLPNGTKQSEVLYIIPKPSHLIANNYTINPTTLDGLVLVFSENEQQYLGGWVYNNGSPVSRMAVLDNFFIGNPGTARCWFEIYEILYTEPGPSAPAIGMSTESQNPKNNPYNYGKNVILSIPIACPDNPQLDPFDPPTVPPNCADGRCGPTGWEWNKPRNGGGGFGNYSPFTPGILKDDYDFNNSALNQYRDGIARILSEVGNRYPDLAQFTPDELKLLVTLIRNTLIKLFPYDANSIDFANPPYIPYSEEFKRLYYQSLAQSLVLAFGPLQVTNPGIIRNKILNEVDNIVRTFYSLSTISETVGRTQGINLVNTILGILTSAGVVEEVYSTNSDLITVNNLSARTFWTNLVSEYNATVVSTNDPSNPFEVKITILGGIEVYFDPTKYNSIKIKNTTSNSKYLSFPNTPSTPAEETYYEQQSTLLLAKYGFASLTALDAFVTIPPGGFGDNPLPWLLAKETIKEYIWLRAKNPSWSKARCLVQAEWNVISEATHYTLDVLGMVPVLGEIPDLINGGIYLLEGNGTDAALSLAATLPIGGQLATAGKWTKNALHAIDKVGSFISPQGILYAAQRYGKDRESLHALNHIYLHFIDDLSKRFQGVFTIPTNEVTGLIDDAWVMIKNNNIQPTVGSDGMHSYIVSMGKTIGREGGSMGSQQALTKLQIFIEPVTNKIRTAYPVK